MENQLCQIPLRCIDPKCKCGWVQGRLWCEHSRVGRRLSFLTDPESLISRCQVAGDRDERDTPGLLQNPSDSSTRAWGEPCRNRRLVCLSDSVLELFPHL